MSGDIGLPRKCPKKKGSDRHGGRVFLVGKKRPDPPRRRGWEELPSEKDDFLHEGKEKSWI